MSDINWDAHGKALAQLSQRHTQLVKMCHEILPTATITFRYKATASPLCPICKADDEDRDHVMRCVDSTKAKWRHQLIGSVQKRCTEMKTRKMLTTILTDGLMQWFNDKQIQPAAYPAPFHRLIKQQNEIGWRQLFNGRFSSEWQQLQNQHLRSNGIKEITLTGQSWTASLIVHLWKSFFDIWDQRNEFVHGKDKSTRDAAKRVKIVGQVKHLHTKTTEVLAAHQSIMFMTAHNTINGQDETL
jgi:hypothetical protein